jgi:beta-lactamase class A
MRTGVVLGLVLWMLGACTTPTPAAPSPPPPASILSDPLRGQIDQLIKGFDGKVGVAIEDVKTGKLIALDGRTYYPQQSVSKLWVALTVLDQVDHGGLTLAEPIVVRREDMSVFNQPIQKKLGADGSYATTLGELMSWCISKSDNAATDILIRRVGGQRAVAQDLASHRLLGLRASPEEHLLESQVAGLAWKPEYSFGQTFWTARDLVPLDARTRLLGEYISNPADGATPEGLVRALARLQRGDLLTPASTGVFMALLTATDTGPLRLKAGLTPGWTIAHKTGTGQDLKDLSTGYNDVGLMMAPNGDAYAIAVMIASTRRPIPERQALMAAISHAVVMAHDAPGQPAG